MYPIQFVLLGIASSVTYKVGNGTEVVVTADNAEDARATLTQILDKWIDASATDDEAITFSNIQIFKVVEGKEYLVTGIFSSAFEDNTNIQKVTIPDSVISIEEDAFSGCSQLSDITLPASLESIGYNAFFGTPWLSGLQNTSKGIATASDEVTKFVIDAPETITDDELDLTNVKVIAGRAFENCNQLNSITIPDSVIRIGNYAFIPCNNLTSVTFEDNGSVWAIDIGGVETQVDVSKYTQSELATLLTDTYRDFIWTKNV